ncbi:MAG: hypothetical protein PVG89_14795 [Gammaproteobacteria bacterium]|jgi:hypothetical protein
MNQNVNPIAAVTIILIAVLLISLIFWARQAALLVGGPDQIQRDPEGNTIIHIAGTLYKVNPSFELMETVDLEALGVHHLVGDFAFFSNGDLLLRRGDYQPGFVESIVRYGRLPDTSPPVANQPDEGLHRCDLSSKECQPFGNNKVDFDSAFHIAIDWNTDTVYLSDTGRHILRKYNASGNELATKNTGYRFPNQITLAGNRLLVADTNHHAIQEAQTNTEHFGEIIATHHVADDTLGGKTWTYAFARVGDQWWINNMNHTMSHGAVAIYDDQWALKQTVTLPANADPIDIMALEHRVLVTDLDNIAIYQLGFDGQRLDLPLPGNMTAHLAELKGSRATYQQVSYAMIGVFILFLIAGFAFAIAQARNADDPASQPSANKTTININDPAINWIPFNKQKLRILKVAMWGPFLLVPVVPLMFLKVEKTSDLLTIALLIMVMGIGPLITRKLFAMGVGTLDDMLVIKKSSKAYAVGKGPDIFYSDTNILIGDVYIPFNQQQLLFDTQKVVTEVMPLLRDATYIKPGQMMNMIIKRQKPLHLVLITAIVVAAVALIMAGIF